MPQIRGCKSWLCNNLKDGLGESTAAVSFAGPFPSTHPSLRLYGLPGGFWTAKSDTWCDLWVRTTGVGSILVNEEKSDNDAAYRQCQH